MKPHKHAEIIKAWADGAEIQYNDGYGWRDIKDPLWTSEEYRIKPDVKIIPNRQIQQIFYNPVTYKGMTALLWFDDNGNFSGCHITEIKV